MRTILPCIITILTVFAFSGCRQDDVSPIRNVRFDPKLLNPLKAAGGCTNYNYYAGSKLRNLGTIHTGSVVVAFDDNLTEAQRDQALTKYGFITGILSQRASQTGLIYTLGLANGLSCAQASQAILELKKDNAIRYAGPVFNVDGSQSIGLSNELLVKTEVGGEAALKAFATQQNAKVIGPLGADTYLMTLDKNSKGNAIELSNALKSIKGIAQATPDFILTK
ncbi:hypothetical protein WG947_02560 [Pontibacter sp. H259]|uniref:hypothetical protein n=1 Tax=Pontibacter sp. H259 TaxID=3133421 RepID=UPI0030BE1505